MRPSPTRGPQQWYDFFPDVCNLKLISRLEYHNTYPFRAQILQQNSVLARTVLQPGRLELLKVLVIHKSQVPCQINPLAVVS